MVPFLPLKTSARPAPSAVVCRSQSSICAFATSKPPHHGKDLSRKALGLPKFANALLWEMLTRTRAASTSTSLSLLDDGEGDEKPQPPQPPPPPPPPPPQQQQQRLSLPLAWRALEAALWPELVITWFSAKKREVTAYLALSRPWNLFPSILMVFAGAAAAAERTKGFSTLSSSPSSSPPSLLLPLLSLLANPTVWQAALSTAAIALGSMVVNDYFDVPNDRVNAPTKPLPSGQITVDGALLFGGFLYLSTLVAAAWLEPRELRLLVASSAAVTLAYTPVLKKIPLVKTVAVAGVVALSPAAGALAVSSSGSFPLASSSLSPALAAVAPACLALFFAISGRELLMDAADARGDGAAGVPTLPVVAGRRATLALAAACELAAAGVLVSRAVALVASSSSASASASASVARQGASSLSFLIPVTVALGTALVLPAARAASAALKLGRLRKEEKRNQKKESLPSSPSPSLIEAEVAVSSAIDKAVNTMMKPVGVAVIGALVLG